MVAVPEESWAKADGHARRGHAACRWPSVRSLSIVIPALDEEENIPAVMWTIPREELADAGCELEVLVVDNASADRTGEVAAGLGARVHVEPVRGYGNAYRAGFAAAHGDVVVTGDADCTYPFDMVPDLIDLLDAGGIDFLSTDRLGSGNRGAMKLSHTVGNRALSAVSRTLFGVPYRDSQSGMWVFRRRIWEHLDVRSNGMQFSQEIKNEAFLKGFCCREVSIEYRQRGGVVKLRAFRDGVSNLAQLASHRARAGRSQAAGAGPEPTGVDLPIPDMVPPAVERLDRA